MVAATWLTSDVIEICRWLITRAFNKKGALHPEGAFFIEMIGLCYIV